MFKIFKDILNIYILVPLFLTLFKSLMMALPTPISVELFPTNSTLFRLVLDIVYLRVFLCKTLQYSHTTPQQCSSTEPMIRDSQLTLIACKALTASHEGGLFFLKLPVFYLKFFPWEKFV